MGRIGLAGHQPSGPMVGVPIPLRVHGYNVQQDGIAIGRLDLAQRTRETHSHSGEHASEKNNGTKRLIRFFFPLFFYSSHTQLILEFITDEGRRFFFIYINHFPFPFALTSADNEKKN